MSDSDLSDLSMHTVAEMAVGQWHSRWASNPQAVVESAFRHLDARLADVIFNHLFKNEKFMKEFNDRCLSHWLELAATKSGVEPSYQAKARLKRLTQDLVRDDSAVVNAAEGLREHIYKLRESGLTTKQIKSRLKFYSEKTINSLYANACNEVARARKVIDRFAT